ncbi:PepSY domain-containing protein [Croceicoccus ponticola]|uniref:PepSY domain-containing protein n=2 Tax=Croceicoccus ponticola TaxID=2217664 RepID=A0A437H2V7_9SPHN|nr:PepSY domain-containing protein [Croceicoccus ponticola]
MPARRLTTQGVTIGDNWTGCCVAQRALVARRSQYLRKRQYKMRKWHRWLSVVFGVFLLWIATTGVLSQLAVLWPPSASAPPVAQAPAGFVCPEGWRCKPPPEDATGIRSMVGLFHHLHSGETFGPIGTAISVLSGLAMIFFSFSGVWLYVRMWNNRKSRKLAPRWFWQ